MASSSVAVRTAGLFEQRAGSDGGFGAGLGGKASVSLGVTGLPGSARLGSGPLRARMHTLFHNAHLTGRLLVHG